MTRLSKTFPSRKNPYRSVSPAKAAASVPLRQEHRPPTDEESAGTKEVASPSFCCPESGKRSGSRLRPKRRSTTRASRWSVYLILSSRLPKTYVGVTTNFSRRLKEHNGELKGGAKASSAGRPWTLACIIQGFKDQSEACELEYKWKNISRKMPRKKNKDELPSNLLLQHREAALNKVKASLDCSHLLIEWHCNSS